eukprot:15433282-Alexandrium_andersonii.AAC.1
MSSEGSPTLPHGGPEAHAAAPPSKCASEEGRASLEASALPGSGPPTCKRHWAECKGSASTWGSPGEMRALARSDPRRPDARVFGSSARARLAPEAQ